MMLKFLKVLMPAVLVAGCGNTQCNCDSDNVFHVFVSYLCAAVATHPATGACTKAAICK